MPDMDYPAIKARHDDLITFAGDLRYWSTNDPMPRVARKSLFLAEDRLADAVEALAAVMEALYDKHPAYRRWALTEGWVDPATPDEEAFVDGLDQEEKAGR